MSSSTAASRFLGCLAWVVHGSCASRVAKPVSAEPSFLLSPHAATTPRSAPAAASSNNVTLTRLLTATSVCRAFGPRLATYALGALRGDELVARTRLGDRNGHEIRRTHRVSVSARTAAPQPFARNGHLAGSATLGGRLRSTSRATGGSGPRSQGSQRSTRPRLLHRGSHPHNERHGPRSQGR